MLKFPIGIILTPCKNFTSKIEVFPLGNRRVGGNPTIRKKEFELCPLEEECECEERKIFGELFLTEKRLFFKIFSKGTPVFVFQEEGSIPFVELLQNEFNRAGLEIKVKEDDFNITTIKKGQRSKIGGYLLEFVKAYRENPVEFNTITTDDYEKALEHFEKIAYCFPNVKNFFLKTRTTITRFSDICEGIKGNPSRLETTRECQNCLKTIAFLSVKMFVERLMKTAQMPSFEIKFLKSKLPPQGIHYFAVFPEFYGEEWRIFSEFINPLREELRHFQEKGTLVYIPVKKDLPDGVIDLFQSLVEKDFNTYFPPYFTLSVFKYGLKFPEDLKKYGISPDEVENLISLIDNNPITGIVPNEKTFKEIVLSEVESRIYEIPPHEHQKELCMLPDFLGQTGKILLTAPNIYLHFLETFQSECMKNLRKEIEPFVFDVTYTRFFGA